MTRTTQITVLAMVCALAGVGVAVAQEHGQRECEHHGRGHGGHMLKKMDANSDGSISREEFNTATQAHFTRMDQNNDGVISGDEMRRGHGGHGQGNHEGHGGHQGRARGGAGTGG